MAHEIRMNADGACLTLNEMMQFTKRARQYGVPADTPVGVTVAEGVAVFRVPVTLVHRTLTDGRSSGKQAMKPARRARR